MSEGAKLDHGSRSCPLPSSVLADGTDPAAPWRPERRRFPPAGRSAPRLRSGVSGHERVKADDADVAITCVIACRECRVAFERGERNGKIWYPSPSDVEQKLGRFPAIAVAVMLSTIPAPPPGAQQSAYSGHDPYADLYF